MSLYDITNATKSAYMNAGNVDEALTFKSFRTLASSARDSLMKAKAERNKANEFATNTFAESLANQKIAESNKEYADYKKETLKVLTDKLVQIQNAKMEQLKKYFIAPPTTEQINLLQALTMQADGLSESELELLIEQTSDNYRALSSLKTIARKSGLDIILPVNADEAIEELNGVANRCKYMLESIDEQDTTISYYAAEFYAKDENGESAPGYFSAVFDELDSAKTYAVPKEEIKISTYELLNDSIDKTGRDGEHLKNQKLRQLKDDIGDEIMTPEEKDAEIRNEINDIMNSEV